MRYSLMAKLGLAALLLSGCAALSPKPDAAPEQIVVPEPSTEPAVVAAPVPTSGAKTVDQLDTTTQAQKAAAAAAPAASTEVTLGRTIASLGDPTAPGFWAETPLVSTVTQGRLEYPETGKSVQVELRPSGGAKGAGSRVSLPALRVLEAPLTALPELVVYSGS